MLDQTRQTGRRVSYESSPQLERIDFTVQSEPGTEIGVRLVNDPGRNAASVPILLVHGARASSVPSFDLDVPGGSLAADLADAGHHVFLMDARNYGNSSREQALDRPPDESPPLTRSEHAVTDIAAVIDHVRRISEVTAVAAFGWATGGQWLAHYAATHPEGLSHLVLFNSIWPASGEWPIGDAPEDPERPGKLKPGSLPGYGYATEEALLARWNDSIPVADIDRWRDPAIAAAYARAAMAGDPASRQHDPPAIRTPLGAMADSFLLSKGHRLFNPDRITAQVRVLRSAHDFWSRPVDILAPRLELTNAASVTCLELSGATHFAHLDHAEHGRTALIEAVIEFLRE